MFDQIHPADYARINCKPLFEAFVAAACKAGLDADHIRRELTIAATGTVYIVFKRNDDEGYIIDADARLSDHACGHRTNPDGTSSGHTLANVEIEQLDDVADAIEELLELLEIEQ